MIAGTIAFVCASSLFAAAASLVVGSTGPAVAWASLAIGGLAAFGASRALGGAAKEESLGWRGTSRGADLWIELAAGALAIGYAVRHFAWLLYRDGNELRSLSPNNLGDLPLHLNLIRYVSSGAPWPLANPIFASEPLRYPLGADLHSALWEAIGVPTASHLFWIGIALVAATVVLLRSWAGWWGVAAVFFSSGWLGWIAPKGSDWQAKLAWKNLFLAVLLTQRGLLFAAPVVLFVLLRARRATLEGGRLSRGEAAWLGFFWGSIAFFHAHAFVATSATLAGLFAIGAALAPEGPRSFAKRTSAAAATALAVAVPIGSAFVLHASAWLQKASIVRLAPGWTRDSEPWLEYLAANFGPWIAVAGLATAAWAWGPLKRSKAWALEAALYFGLFAAFFNVILAPWPWDNVKVLIWPAIGLARSARDAIGPALRAWAGSGGSGARGFATASLAFLVSASGLRALKEASETQAKSVKIASVVELANAAGAVRDVPVDAVFLAKPSYDHVLASLGRARALGYEGHLWSHAIDSRGALAKAERVLRGDPDWARLVRELKITHIFWGPQERAEYGDGPRPWDGRLANVSGVPGYAVYRVDPAP